MASERPAKTITVTARTRTRFSRLKVRHPGSPRPWLNRLADRVNRTADIQRCVTLYNADLAMELLAGTAEIPDSKRDLIVVLAHYRHALHDLATQVRASQHPPGANR